MWFICCFTSNLNLLTRYLCSVLRPLGVSDLIFNNYSPKWRWIVCNYSPKWRWIGQDIHRAAFEHTGLFISTEVIITLAYTNQWISEVKNYNLSIFMPYFEICKQTRIHVSVLLLLWNWDAKCSKIKLYLGKHPHQISMLSLYWLGWLSLLFLKFNFAQNFRRLGRHVVNFVCSHTSHEYPRIFLDREPIRARGKHYSMVWYMLMNILYRAAKRRGGYFSLGTDAETNIICFRASWKTVHVL